MTESIVNMYTLLKELSPEMRLKHCLHALGPPIIRGGSTTLLGVGGLIFHPR